MLEPDEYGKPLDRDKYKALFDAIGDAFPENPEEVPFVLPPMKPDESDPVKPEEQLRLTREAIKVLREIVVVQGQRIDNVENWLKKLEDKLDDLLAG
jgi:hypothetical protein